MGVQECGAMVIGGVFDVFDRAIAVVELVEKELADREIPAEFHPERETLDGEKKCPAHFFDPKAEWLADLDRAKEMITEACQIAQNVMGGIQ